MDDAVLMQGAWLREVLESARSTLGLASEPSLEHLDRLRTLHDDLDRLEAGLVVLLRARGVTWQAIADANGVADRQTAFGRLSRRSARWRESVLKPVGGSLQGLSDVLPAAWTTVVAELGAMVQVFGTLNPSQPTALPAMSPRPAFVAADIKDERGRRSPSRIPRQ